MSFDVIVSALDGAKERGGRFSAKCPAHNDKSPSLLVSENDDGSTRVHCFAGCKPADILAALGLSEREAWKPLKGITNQQRQIHSAHVTRVMASANRDAYQIKMMSTDFVSKKINANTVIKRISKMAPSVFYPSAQLGREAKSKRIEVERAWVDLAILVSPTTETLTELLHLMIKFGRREDRQPIIKWADQDYAKDFIDSIKN